MELTLGQINAILRIATTEQKAKYKAAFAKLSEVKAYLTGKTQTEPKDPFLPLTQLPKDLLQ